MTVEEVYKRFDTKGVTSHHEMSRLLRCAAGKEADRIVEDPAEWGRSYLRAFGQPGWLHSLSWFNYVRMAIDAGYYGLCTVDFKKQGGPDTDHWVLICGARTKGCVTGELITGEVLVSCSARSSGMKDEWVDVRDFLRDRGGFDVLFVRPALATDTATG